jgi:DNA-binding MarR family transcriptional regulator
MEYISISPSEHKLLKALSGILEQPEPSRSIRKQLAKELGVSEETVKTQLEKLSKKFAIEKSIRGEQRYRKIIFVHRENKCKKSIEIPQNIPRRIPQEMRELR